MSEAPDNHELARQIAVPEERMNTKHAEYQSSAERVRADLAQMFAQRAESDAAARWWQTAIILAGIGIAETVLVALLK